MGTIARVIGVSSETDLVHLAGAETITGTKTFQTALGSVGLIIKNVAGQNVSQQEWHDDLGNVLTKMTQQGNLVFTGSARGIILTSPGGSLYRVTVTDAGALGTVAA